MRPVLGDHGTGKRYYGPHGQRQGRRWMGRYVRDTIRAVYALHRGKENEPWL